MYLVRSAQCSRSSTLRHFKAFQRPQQVRQCHSDKTTEKVESKYSDTLNLPQTNFPMRANAKQRESQLIFSSVYQWQQENNSGPMFVNHDGPPYANGSPHMGHALNKILKDFVNRYKMLRGYKVSYIPGWDCHGLPIELKALELVKKNAKKGDPPPTPTQLRKLARSYALEQIEQQKKAFVSWGVMGDWDNAYKTMDYEYESRQIGVFLKLFHRGLIYRASKPVFWSPSSITALAEAELEYNENHVSPSVYVLFPIQNQNDKFSEFENLSIMIWTTTPWTLPANKALCVNSEFNYCITSLDGGSMHFVVAEGLLPKIETVLEKKLPVLKVISGSELVGVVCNHPFRPQPSPVLHGNHVTLESGTGIVHTAPGHGVEDFKICADNGISAFVPVNDYGKFTAEAGQRFQGKFVLKEGNEEVIKQLKEVNALVHFSDYKHKYPYDWRTKKPVIVRATSQWFAGLTSIRDQATSELKENVSFAPAYGLTRLSSMVHTRDDWCISRQRAWGVPIPVFFDKETQQPLMNEDTIEHIQKLFLEHGSDCWWDMELDELLPPSYRGQDKYVKGNDTMDVWFDSGVSWEAVVNGHGLPKADIYLEGSDQHRGWFQSSLLTSVGATNQAPYKKIITHGFVLDGEGRKMSKSIGNVIEPLTVIQGGKVGKEQFEGFGVDALRFWVASTDYSSDVNISASLITEMSNQIRKLRNTARFMLGNLSDYDGSEVPYSELLDLDKYMLHRLSEWMTSTTQNYDTFSFGKELSAFYFDIIKDRLYTSEKNSAYRRSTQYVLTQAFTTAMAPVLCHTTEDIFQHSSMKTGNKESIFQCGWFEPKEEWKNAEVDQRWKRLRELRQQFHLTFEEVKKSNPETVRTSTDVNVKIVAQKGSEIHKIVKFLETHFAGEVFIASRVTFEASEGLEKEYELQLTPSTVQKCPRCWKKVDSSDNLFCDKNQCPSVGE